MKSLLTILTILATTISGFAQQGTLSGKVTDKLNGEAIIGAVVFIKGSAKGTTTDFEGRYSLPLEAGLYQISITSLSYKPTEHTNIKIETGKTTTLDVQIEQNTTELQAVTIVGTRQTNTELALMENMRQSEVVVSGVSGEQIAKSLDRDAAETVKRIPGVTIMNDRYVVIRGMNQRYNTVMLNDALTPSTEPDAKAFSFDILPTSVIDRIMIYKNGSPELPGEFGGGVIKIYTRNVVDEDKTSFSLSSSYRSGTTFQNFNTYKGSKTDFLGFDNGYRAIPNSFPDNLNSVNQEQRGVLGRDLPNSWAPEQVSAIPDMRLSFGVNRRLDIGSVRLSNVSAISYSNTRTNTVGTRDTYLSFIPELGRSERQFSFNDEVSAHNVRLGIIHNWTARLSNNHKLEFRNLFNQLGSSEVLRRQGIDFSNANQEQLNYSLRYESRTIYSGQLQGTHDLNDEKSTLTWTGGYAYTNRNEPDYRRFRTFREAGSKGPYEMTYKFTPSLNDAGRFYSELNENTVMANTQFEHRFSTTDSTAENAPKVRAGLYAERKHRNYDSRYFSYIPANISTFDNSILFQSYDQVFAPENINSQTGWRVEEDINPQNNYEAQSNLLAGYVGGATPLTSALSVSGGVRVEYNQQELRSVNLDGSRLNRTNPVLSVLPAANFTYTFTPRSMLRAGASISVNRPEFRELAPAPYYDFINLLEVTGNPNLETATIYNGDLRYEFYPNPTEIVSLGVFYKYFNKPIETVFQNTSGANSITFDNARQAYSYGLEAEVRKSLLGLTASPVVDNLSLVLNAALVQSRVQLDEKYDNQSTERPMMGQSPYVVNTGLYYQDDTRQLQFSMLYNVIGTRIFAVGSNLRPTVYELPRNVIDFSVTKAFGQNLELKAGIQDILNQKTRLIQDSNDDARITGIDESFREFRKGRYATLGATYKF
ncbi:MAG: TonB-dependent receptor [Hymenobacteraceae bacterium]|nr:TonB-dependent receptor [Hymenobacteraceae bacterium]